MPGVRKDLSHIDNYPEYLNGLWEKHLTPKEQDAPMVVSLFAGCGGSSLGYSMAGFRELLAVEWDDNAANTFGLNFPNVPLYHGDITQLSVDQILETIRLKPGELDVLDGSPPCQGFSMVGKRNISDPRNSLFIEYARLLKGIQPKVFVMENVAGLVTGKMRLVFSDILRELKGCGYCISARLMDTQWFGVPQARRRVIFIGTRNDLGIVPTHPGGIYNPIPARDAVIGTVFPSAVSMPLFDDSYANLWDRIRLGGSAYDIIGKGYNGCHKIDPDRPSPTLPKTQGGRGFATLAHWGEKRAITIEEAKRLQGYPDEFVFTGKYVEQWARIGNSVPPPFMMAIAEHITNEIL